MARAVETVSGLKKAQETIAVSVSREKSLTENVSSLMEELSALRATHANLRADLVEETAFVQQLKDNLRKSLYTVSTEVQKTYVDMVHVVKRNFQEDLVDEWKIMKTHFRFELAHFKCHG